MDAKQTVTRTTTIFTGLVLAGIVIGVSVQIVSSNFAQTLMVAIGSATFGSGLTFFLVRMSNLEE